MAKSKIRVLQETEQQKNPKLSYGFDEGMAMLQSMPARKFPESVEIAIKLGIDPKKSDQVVRGATLLPNGSGKSVRVAVFARGVAADAATAAGAEYVGMDDLAQQFQAGTVNVDVVIASPDAMGVVGRLGPLLGPRGLMPNPKVGTVTPDVAKAIHNAKAGQVRFRADKNGIVHCAIGKLNFEIAALKQNLEALMADLRKGKPSNSKGVYFQKLTLSTTMGLGLTIDLSSLTF